ncbi:extracellular solute-binding protein [Mesorhizobium sp. WSM2561]|uniref:extracellular solute-binding protein n=1 Tax=Mesorhizobium sp. WSM2561 TaxID=1040985 RepID=UPI0004B820E2|nr:extracellular solute-binding protein [Mesorhizobium sp. WSM2561]
MKIKFVIGLCGLATFSLGSSAVPAMAQDRQVVLASSGGAYDTVLREYWLDPFEQATGIKLIVVPTGGSDERRARVQALIEAADVSWDIFVEGEMDAKAPSHAERAANIDEFCRQFGDRPDLLLGSCEASGALFGRGATLIAHNKNHFPNGGPTNWEEFWDTTEFRGVRAMPAHTDAWRQLTAALLADGVPRDKLCPMDVDRAFKKLDELRPMSGCGGRPATRRFKVSAMESMMPESCI